VATSNEFQRRNTSLRLLDVRTRTAALADGQVAHEGDGEERQDRNNDASSGHPFLLDRPSIARSADRQVALKKLRAAMLGRKGPPQLAAFMCW
jgi:hypothetical protein